MSHASLEAGLAPARVVGTPGSAPRLRGLDALRGIAASAVVLYHLSYGFRDVLGLAWPLPVLRLAYGGLGVHLFFIISGFVILRTLERSRGLGDFAVSRISRLVPGYLTCGAMTAALIFITGFNPFGVTPRDALLNVFMISRLLGVRQIDYSYWTLQYEVLFYAGAALVYFVFKVRQVELGCLAWLAVMLVGHALDWPHSHMRLSMIFDVPFANLFVIGMMIHRLAQGPRSSMTWLTLGAALAMGIVPPWGVPAPLLFPATIAFAALVWLAARDRLGPLCIRPVLFMGEISYPLYLIHQVVGYWVIYRAGRLGLDVNVGEVAATLTVVGLAACVRTGVEVPAQRAIRAAYRRLGGATHATEPLVMPVEPTASP